MIRIIIIMFISETFGLNQTERAQIFKKSRCQLKILGARRVTRRKFPYWESTNLNGRGTKFSRHGNLVPDIFVVLTKGMQRIQVLHTVILNPVTLKFCEIYCWNVGLGIKDTDFQKNEPYLKARYSSETITDKPLCRVKNPTFIT